VKSETSNKSLMYYWQNIVNEKGQVSQDYYNFACSITDADASLPNERLESSDYSHTINNGTINGRTFNNGLPKKTVSRISNLEKDWTNSRENSGDQNGISVNIGHLQVEQFATGNSQVIKQPHKALSRCEQWNRNYDAVKENYRAKLILEVTSPPLYSGRDKSFEESTDGLTEASPVITGVGAGAEVDDEAGKHSTKYMWITRDGHNISVDFRNFQLKSIEKLEANPTLSYAKEIDLVLCLSSIMYCNELKSEYVECSEKTWNEARPRSLIPKELPTVADLVIIEYNRLLNDNTKWRGNWSKGNTADGESESSKERRLLDGHNHGRKPDFRILSKIDDTEREFIFSEIKPPHCPNTINTSIIN
ncbi:13494_t:CDS:10, partial [Funneliformis caledonium]